MAEQDGFELQDDLPRSLKILAHFGRWCAPVLPRSCSSSPEGRSCTHGANEFRDARISAILSSGSMIMASHFHQW